MARLSRHSVSQLEALLAQDPAARDLLEGYRKLDSAMREKLAMPEIAWDEFANKISSAVGERNPIVAARGQSRFAFRAMAIAACALIAVGVLIFTTLQSQSPPSVPVAIQPAVAAAPAAVQIANVTGPQIETASAPAVASIKIGPPPGAESASNFDPYLNAEAVVVVRPSVSIAAAEKLDDTTQNSR